MKIESIRELVKKPYIEVDPKDEKDIRQPYTYLQGNPGKNVRSTLMDVFNMMLELDAEKLSAISHVVETLHTASLLVDDIQDSSNIRRGKPTAHLVYGVPLTINAANYMYFSAFQDVIKLSNGDVRMLNIFNEEMVALHKGQGMELSWRDHARVPTEDQYWTMCMGKTGGLFRLSVRLMLLLGNSKDELLLELANLLGLLYQLRDDYLNLHPQSVLKKDYCEDITEGKYSFLLIHGIQNDSNDIIASILKQHTSDIALKTAVVDLLQELGSFDYARQSIDTLHGEIEIVLLKLEARYGHRVQGVRKVIQSMVV